MRTKKTDRLWDKRGELVGTHQTLLAASRAALAQMSPAHHTPGPWRVGAEADLPIYGGPNDFYLAKAYGDPDFLADDERRANARLIAAAPEMLALLTGLLAADVIENHTPEHDVEGICVPCELVREARALLARIEGR